MAYNDYFGLSKTYHSVISEATIPQSCWKETYPHDTFIDLLKKTERMLSRADSNSVKPIWIHGAYGTGKSRIAWTLKELLDCKPEELIEYFEMYPELRNVPELRDKLLGLKKGNPILTVIRFASSQINSLDQLIVAIYRGVAEALQA